MKLVSILFAALVFFAVLIASPGLYAQQPSPLANAVILIIRHADKPDSGAGLAPAGEQRAAHYVSYFEHYTVGSKPLHLDYLFAAADTRSSIRPRLTLEPLSQALGLKIDTTFNNKDYESLANSLQTNYYGKSILICWHHENIAGLLDSLGVDPSTLIPHGKWPEDQYGWILQLCYDKDGRLIPSETRRIDDSFVPTAPGT